MAYITISVSTNMDTFQLNTGSNLVLTVCGSYFGRSLDGRPLSESVNGLNKYLPSRWSSGDVDNPRVNYGWPKFKAVACLILHLASDVDRVQ